MTTTSTTLTHAERRRVIELLNDALSSEYNSFVGYVLNSNPYVEAGNEADVAVLERIRDEENAACKALLVHLGRYRAGPCISGFRYWKQDLNFLALDYLVVHAASAITESMALLDGWIAELPDDVELKATFGSIRAVKARHQAEIAKLAVRRKADRDKRRDTAHAVTKVKVKLPKRGGAAKPAAGTKPPGAPRPPGAPKPPSPPLPPGFKAPKPPGAPKAPSPPLPPGFKVPAHAKKKAAPAAPAKPAAPPKPKVPFEPYARPAGRPTPPGLKAPIEPEGPAREVEGPWKEYERPAGRPTPPGLKKPIEPEGPPREVEGPWKEYERPAGREAPPGLKKPIEPEGAPREVEAPWREHQRPEGRPKPPGLKDS